ncbi:MAG: hypothetical protein MPK30_05675, partial [Gammaproteobacteria bacterium]|nr:hypothetical protein [Gammaproteobacteria bacterium]
QTAARRASGAGRNAPPSTAAAGAVVGGCAGLYFMFSGFTSVKEFSTTIGNISGFFQKTSEFFSP